MGESKEPAVPGMGEWIVILIIVLLVFGANKLPSIGDALGRSIKNFKRASAGDEDKDKDAEEEPAPKKAKQVAGGKSAKQIEEGAKASDADDDDEWEEVVVRRRKKKAAAASDEG
jgi:sec-independent protein translocase protein TatA